MYVEPEMARYYLSILKDGRASSNPATKDKRFLEFHNALYGDLKRKLRARYQIDSAIADDVLSEVFVKIITAKNYPNDPATFFAWISMICRNEYINYYRKYIKKDKNHQNFSEERNEEIDSDALANQGNLDGGDVEIQRDKDVSFRSNNDQVDDFQSPKTYMTLPENVHTEELPDMVVNQVKKDALVDCVRSAVKVLHAKSIDKSLAIEWHMDGLSSQQIAHILGRSDDATRRLLSDARKILKQLSAKCFEMIK